MRAIIFSLSLLFLALSFSCTKKTVNENVAASFSSPQATTSVKKVETFDWDFEDDIYPDNEYSEPLAKFYSKEKKIIYAGYEITKSFEKRGGKVSIKVNKNGHNLLTLDYEGLNSYGLRWGLFPFLGKQTKQLVIMKYSGGAHCCTSYKIYDLLPEPKIIFDGDEYSEEEIGDDLKPLDVDKDGIFEFTQSVMTFDYFYVSHARSVFPAALFAYDKKQQKYLPANRRFPNYLLRGIEKDLRVAKKINQRYTKNVNRVYDEVYHAAIMQVVLKYVFAGQKEKGWDFFEKNYRATDKDELRKDLQKALHNDPIYESIY